MRDHRRPANGSSPQQPSELRPASSLRTFTGCIAALALGLNVIFCAFLLLFPVALLKLLSPRRSRLRLLCDRALNAIAGLWIENNARWERATQSLHWDVAGVEDLRPESWYLVVCNHQSWVDILVLQRVLHGRIPLLKFFLKSSLIYVPFMGVAWWALDFPFMQRHSKEYLDMHPEQRGRDLAITRKACERFSHTPTSVLNFLEGTRLTAAKHARQESPFRYLLRPKAAGLALAVEALGDKFSSLLSVTIVYPDAIPTFWQFLCNRLPRVTVRATSTQIPADLFGGDYQEDADHRQRFQSWVNAQWAAKDSEIAALKSDPAIAS